MGNDLSARIARLGADERRIISAIVSRLERGYIDYGALDMHDGRDWRREADEELLDYIVYSVVERLAND